MTNNNYLLGIFKNRYVPLLFMAIVLLFASCANSTKHVSSVSKQEVDFNWPSAYQDAIIDALNPEPDEIANNLTPILETNTNLIWETINGTPHLLMVSLVSNTSYYKDYVGKPYNTGNHDIWVSAVPELKKVCNMPGFGGDDKQMRLRQLLGLTPNAVVTAFVEFWVEPGQLFRPAADNEITDTSAGLSIPDNAATWYRKWFNELRAKQYYQCANPEHNAYPWTQLGYTYDLGNSESVQGLSEFVIKTNSEVIVKDIIMIDDYCK